MSVKGLFLCMAIFLTHTSGSNPFELMPNNQNPKENNLETSSCCSEHKDEINDMKQQIEDLHEEMVYIWKELLLDPRGNNAYETWSFCNGR